MSAACAAEGIAEGACDCDGNGPEAGYDCDGNRLADADSDGVVTNLKSLDVRTQLPELQCDATDDDGARAELDECGVCGGNGIADGACDCDGNGPKPATTATATAWRMPIVTVCDEFEVAGVRTQLPVTMTRIMTTTASPCRTRRVWRMRR